VALGMLSALAGRWFVVKVGGELAIDRTKLANSVGRAIHQFLSVGIKVAVVHGAGPQATALSERLGLTSRIVAGRRITDEATLEVMKMTLAGQVSVDIASAFRVAGVTAIATTGVSAGLIDATKRPATVIASAGPDPIDFGWVGDVCRVNTDLLEKLAAAGVVMLIASLAGDANGTVFNINADTVATRVAAQLDAARLFLVSNVPGVLRDKTDPRTRISRLTPSEARAQIAAGVIQGGMVPKVEESLAMLDQRIGAIHIVGLDPPEGLLQEAALPGSFGTVFERDPRP